MPLFNSELLRAWRENSGLRVEEVCARAGVSYPYLRSLEAGRQDNPSLDVVARLAAVFGRAPGDLLVPGETARAAS